ncbi:MAG: peptidase in kexin sedolisin [Actinomycetia bacterium]|nr:peptidase in kexin sedolisin [Actinomycetes bacterium]
MIARVALLSLCTLVIAAPPAGAATARVSAPLASLDLSDPLIAQEWWRAAVHIDALTPPGPGVPVSIVDSGVSFQHPEFVGDTNIVALNNQEPAPIGGVHGTAVASVIAAPVNGVGLVGIYPTAVVRSFDASLGDGTRLPASDIVAGILAAAHAGRSVINLSLGSNLDDPDIDAAIAEAVRLGSLVVAASGNSGDEGSPPSYPAVNAHVLTVGATDQSDQPASFSSRSPFVDLAAPGVDIPVATALDNSFAQESGTSFASPIVAGAAAWLWTVRPDLDASQVAEVLRRSARDVFTPGYDTATGYGILDLAAALTAPTPLRDSAEPNDDAATAATVTTRTRVSGRTSGRVAAYEDPRDVLRVWLPAKKRLVVSSTSTSGVSLALYQGGIASSDRLATSTRMGVTTSLSYTNRKAGRTAYLVVTPARGVRSAEYTTSLAAK